MRFSADIIFLFFLKLFFFNLVSTWFSPLHLLHSALWLVWEKCSTNKLYSLKFLVGQVSEFQPNTLPVLVKRKNWFQIARFKMVCLDISIPFIATTQMLIFRAVKLAINLFSFRPQKYLVIFRKWWWLGFKYARTFLKNVCQFRD